MSSFGDFYKGQVSQITLVNGGMYTPKEGTVLNQEESLKYFPEISIESGGEEYYPQIDFSYGFNSIIVKNRNTTTTYDYCGYTIIKALMPNLKEIWIDGRNAPYESCFEGHYLDGSENRKECHSFKITEIDNKTNEVLFEKEIDFLPDVVHDVHKYERRHKKETKTIYDKNEMIKLLNINGLFYKQASNELKCDKEIVDLAVSNNGEVYCFLPSKYQEMRDVKIKTLISSPHMVHFMEKELRNDLKFAIEVIKENIYFYDYLTDELKNNDAIKDIYKKYNEESRRMIDEMFKIKN